MIGAVLRLATGNPHSLPGRRCCASCDQVGSFRDGHEPDFDDAVDAVADRVPGVFARQRAFNVVALTQGLTVAFGDRGQGHDHGHRCRFGLRVAAGTGRVGQSPGVGVESQPSFVDVDVAAVGG